jgi:alpha-L-arabinofuranosidase
MKMTKGETYYFSFYAKRDKDLDAPFDVRIESPTGELYAQTTIPAITGTWAKYTDSLVSNVDDTSAQLVVLATGTGTVYMDMISLFPKTTYKNRPNGLRPDMVEMLADLKPGFFRFPGGCIVHGDGLANAYRWKESIGDLAERKENWNLWGGANHQSLGLGYFEYFQLCEDIGAKPVPVLPMGMSCQGRKFEVVPLDQMGPWIEDILDVIEFANGPVTSTWGSKRAAMGHPEPFNMEYIGIGNEERINSQFKERFTMAYNAVRNAYPRITIVGTSGIGASGGEFDLGWSIAKELKVPVVDEHFYMDASWFIKAAKRYDNYDRNGPKVMVGEYAAETKSTWRGALGDAAFTTGLERNGGVVEFSCYGPGAALYTFNKNSIQLKGTYHEEKMFAENLADTNLVFTTTATSDSFCISAGKDAETKDIIIKIVNATGKITGTLIKLNGTASVGKSAKAIVLTGETDAIYLAPTEKTIAAGTSFTYSVPAFSFTVLRIPTVSPVSARPHGPEFKRDFAISLFGQPVWLPSELRVGPMLVELFDVRGKLLQKSRISCASDGVPSGLFAQYPRGVYLARFTVRNDAVKCKVVKMK